jgi:hypothetical protein
MSAYISSLTQVRNPAASPESDNAATATKNKKKKNTLALSIQFNAVAYLIKIQIN